MLDAEARGELRINKTKVRTSFPCAPTGEEGGEGAAGEGVVGEGGEGGGHVAWFPWCGLEFDTTSLHVRNDLERCVVWAP